MATETSIDLATLRFDGERFAGHTLDVECTQELVAYRRIILECAKALWRRKHVDRERLPARFEDSFRLQFDRLEEGSARVPLRRVLATEQAALDWGNRDEFDEAAELVDAAIRAANDDALLPEAFPSNVVALFREFGRTLRDDEVLFTRAHHGVAEAAYSPKARKRLAEWVAATYEDVVEVTGEVQMASVKGQFSLLTQAGSARSRRRRFWRRCVTTTRSACACAAWASSVRRIVCCGASTGSTAWSTPHPACRPTSKARQTFGRNWTPSPPRCRPMRGKPCNPRRPKARLSSRCHSNRWA